MIKKNLHLILLLFLLLDIGYSFVQHLNIGLDGDMAITILPGEWFKKALEDPFGLSVLFKNEVYAAPNRFFVHWSYSKYFKVAPGILQNIVNPIDSLYLTSALAKTAIQVFLTLLLAAYISGKTKIFSKEFLIAAILVTPFFITYEYWRLGIIDWSITFTFFYAMPISLLLLFFLPFFRKIFYGEELNTSIAYKIYLILLAIIISLTCPLIPGVVLIVCPAIILNIIYQNLKEPASQSTTSRLVSSVKKIPKDILFYFILISVLSIYSLYIGKNNIENTTVETSLLERYSLLPNGFINLLREMTLLTPLIIAIAVNAFIIRIYFYSDEGKIILSLLKWIVICSVIFMLLLPLGGFRTYRPNILRYDTILPITISLIMIFGITTRFLLSSLSGKFKVVFLSVVIIFLLMYCYEDKSTVGDNKCQREGLREISESKDSIVLVKSDCTILSWKKITDYKESEENSEMLQYWGVTKEKKLYYQK